jgi:hypothetical protein
MTSRAVSLIAIAGSLCVSTGCVQNKLRALEKRQLETELTNIRQASSFLTAPPQLGVTYSARAFLSSRAMNQFLDGYSGYEIPLKSPRGAKILIENVDFDFRDGTLAVLVDAKATNRSKTLEINLRIRADLVTEIVDGESKLSIRPLVQEIVPDVKVSIFRFRLFWFAQRLLLVPAQKYADALPASEVNVDLDFDVDLPGGERREKLEVEDGTISIKFDTPPLKRQFMYSVSNALYLKEGMYLYFIPKRAQ